MIGKQVITRICTGCDYLIKDYYKSPPQYYMDLLFDAGSTVISYYCNSPKLGGKKQLIAVDIFEITSPQTTACPEDQ